MTQLNAVDINISCDDILKDFLDHEHKGEGEGVCALQEKARSQERSQKKTWIAVAQERLVFIIIVGFNKHITRKYYKQI